MNTKEMRYFLHQIKELLKQRWIQAFIGFVIYSIILICIDFNPIEIHFTIAEWKLLHYISFLIGTIPIITGVFLNYFEYNTKFLYVILFGLFFLVFSIKIM